MTVCSGPSRLGQKLAGHRHALRRGPAAVRREPLELRPPVPGAACRSPGSSGSAGSRRRSASSRRRPARARARPSGRLPRFTTTCAFSWPGWASPTARSAACRSAPRPPTRSSRRSSICRRGRRSSSWPRWSGATARRMRRSGTSCEASGFARVRVDGKSVNLDSPPKLSHRRKHRVEVVVDRAVVRRSTRSRLADSVESALDLGKGVIHVARVGDDGGRAALARRPLQPAPLVRRVAGGALKSSRRITSRSTARSAGARSARAWARSRGPTPPCWFPTPGEPPRGGRRRLARISLTNPPLRPDDRGPRRGRGNRSGYCPSTISTAGIGGSSSTAPGDTWYTRAARRPRLASPAFSFQYKGLFPAIEEAGRVSFIYRWKLQGMVDDVPCAACMGARLRDDAAAVRFHGYHARPDQPLAARGRP